MSWPPRVLTVTNMYPVPSQPAQGSFVASQVESLRQIGVETDVIFVDGLTSRWNYLRGVETVRRALASKNYDLVHAHYGLTGWLGRCQLGRPLVVSYCGDDLLGTPRAPRSPIPPDRRYPRTPLSVVLVGASHALERLATQIIVKSEDMRRHLLLPSSRKRAHVIPNGVNLDMMRGIPRDEARAQLGLAPDARLVLFPHTAYSIRKRLDLAEAAMRELKRRRPEAELLVVFHQPPERMPLYYSAADALIVTSEWEGSPNVVKEALACDLPVVSVATGDVEERIAGLAECALCPRDPAALAAALDRVLDLPRTGALRRSVEHLDILSVARKILGVYATALGTRQEPAVPHLEAQ